MKMMGNKAAGLAAVLAATFFIGSSNMAAAYDPPIITRDLGGFPISCSIYPAQAGLGGIHTGASIADITNTLGAPKRTANDGSVKYYYEGLTLTFVDFGGTGEPILCDIRADKEMGNQGYATPDGVSVGMPEDILNTVYGMADNVYIERHTAPKLTEEQNQQYDMRLNKTVYTYNVGECLSMYFTVQRGIITEIRIRQVD